jgi:lysophospholipase L1-like esterase
MRPVRLLALGDSYTIGESVPEDKRWPVLLASRLRAEGLPVEVPLIVARSGWTSADLLRGIQQAGIQGTYDLVFLLIGVNNQYRGEAQETYRKELRELLAKAIQFTSGDHGRVIVLSIPDWGDSLCPGPRPAKDCRRNWRFQCHQPKEAEGRKGRISM